MSSIEEAAAVLSETIERQRSPTGLLPCPFCGSVDLSGVESGTETKRIYFVECNVCNCIGPVVENKNQARVLWDTRRTIA